MLHWIAIALMAAALAFAACETWRQVRSSPANDHDQPPPKRYVLRMRSAAGVLGVAVLLALIAHLTG